MMLGNIKDAWKRFTAYGREPTSHPPKPVVSRVKMTCHEAIVNEIPYRAHTWEMGDLAQHCPTCNWYVPSPKFYFWHDTTLRDQSGEKMW